MLLTGSGVLGFLIAPSVADLGMRLCDRDASRRSPKQAVCRSSTKPGSSRETLFYWQSFEEFTGTITSKCGELTKFVTRVLTISVIELIPDDKGQFKTSIADLQNRHYNQLEKGCR
jgi:hypothetical protein